MDLNNQLFSDDTIGSARLFSAGVSDFVGANDRLDFYKLSITGGTRARITLDGLSGDADIDLIQDVNGNGRVDAGEILRTSDEALDRPESILLSTLGTGDYYIRVQSPFGADTNYRLSVDLGGGETGNTFATAGELGIITGRRQTLGSVFVADRDQADVYRFTLLDRADVQISLDGSAHVYLAQDLNENGLYDLDDTIVSSRLPANQLQSIPTTNLAAGQYFIYVDAVAGGSTYTLNTTVDTAGSTRATAKYLGGFGTGTNTISEYVGGTDTRDYYRFQLNTAANTNITLSGLTGNVDMYLFADRNRNGQFDDGEFSRGSFQAGNATEQINLAGLAAGEYSLIVTTNLSQGASPYQLNLSTTALTTARRQSGSFASDSFTIGTDRETIISGNGNYNFGRGQFDTLNLSAFNLSDAQFNILGLNGGTGVTLDLDRSPRRFDQITLSNGQQILFEGIERIEFRDRNINLAVRPNDPLFGDQWNLHMMGVQSAWRFTTGSDQVAIAVEDTGLGFDAAGNLHPDLRRVGLTAVNASEIADEYRYEWLNNEETLSHGTAVQGVIAATSDNNLGIAGINWNSRVIAADVLGANAGDTDLATATSVVLRNRRSPTERLVVNLSLGALPYATNARDDEFEAVVAANPDVLFVIASGNENRSSLSEPAALARRYGNVIAVGAAWGPLDANPTDAYNDQVPGTRISYPPGVENGWGSNYGDGLTLMGPSEFYALQSTQGRLGSEFGYLNDFNGTSAATPNVAGVASLVWSANPNLTAAQVRQILSSTAIDVASPGYDRDTGYGFVNAEAAVRSAIAYA
jgi:serine protease